MEFNFWTPIFDGENIMLSSEHLHFAACEMVIKLLTYDLW